MIVVLALYKFVSLSDLPGMQKALQDVCKTHAIKGTLLLAHEGINGTVSGPRAGIDALKDWLENTPPFGQIDFKESFTENYPFSRMKVKLKREIVTMGIPSVDPTRQVGEYVDAREWNALLQDPNVLVIDTRNDYEYGIGTFKNAVNPKTDNFRQFPEFIQKNVDPKAHASVAIFCTGGIRCEKASSYLLQAGFEKVYHLKGGILKYLETMPVEESLWEGECFVFDQRVAVDHQLQPGQYTMCHACRHPLSEVDRQSPLFIQNITCPHCAHVQTPENRSRATERAKQIALSKGVKSEKEIVPL